MLILLVIVLSIVCTVAFVVVMSCFILSSKISREEERCMLDYEIHYESKREQC